MNIQQLEYIVAIDNHRHFAKAAEACHISQPTLSAMTQKLEEELDIKIFDRSKYPVEPTKIGAHIIEQARVSLRNFQQIREIVENERNSAEGVFRLGIIPTIAPYMVPELLRHWEKRPEDYRKIELILKESTTGQIIEQVQSGTLDGGLLAGPLHHSKIVEYPIYCEKFYAYVSKEKKYNQKKIDLEKIDINNIWLLENVHCLRGQIEHLCRMKKDASQNDAAARYEAGSIDTLINIVDYNFGMTIIPEMSAMGLSEERQENLREFKNITAVREVCLAVSHEYVRKTMIQIITNFIKESVPKSMLNPELKDYIVPL